MISARPRSIRRSYSVTKRASEHKPIGSSTRMKLIEFDLLVLESRLLTASRNQHRAHGAASLIVVGLSLTCHCCRFVGPFKRSCNSRAGDRLRHLQSLWRTGIGCRRSTTLPEIFKVHLNCFENRIVFVYRDSGLVSGRQINWAATGFRCQ